MIILRFAFLAIRHGLSYFAKEKISPIFLKDFDLVSKFLFDYFFVTSTTIVAGSWGKCPADIGPCRVTHFVRKGECCLCQILALNETTLKFSYMIEHTITTQQRIEWTPNPKQ